MKTRRLTPRRLQLAAALLALMSVGVFMLLRSSNGPDVDSDGEGLASGPPTAPRTADPTGSAGAGDPGSTTRSDGDTNLMAAPDSPGTGEREAVSTEQDLEDPGRTSDVAQQSGNLDTNDARATARERSIVGQLWWPMDGPGNAAEAPQAPNEATVWVKPIVPLPQVADPVAHDVRLVFESIGGDLPDSGPGQGRVAAFSLAGALVPAAELGAAEVMVQTEIAGAAPMTKVLSVAELMAQTISFVPEAGITITGTVVDEESGTPLPGAVVIAIDQVPLDALNVTVDLAAERLPKPYCITDAQGRFKLEDVRKSGSLRLRASAAGFAPRMIERAGANGGPVAFELGRGSSVFGVAELADGTRASGAGVILSRIDGDPAAKIRSVMTFGRDITETDGTYRVDGLPAGQYVALLFHDANAAAPSEYRQIKVDPSSERRVDFLSAVSAANVTLEGVLLSVEGQPVPGGNLTLSAKNGRMDATEDWRADQADDEGRFRFAGLEEGEYLLHRSEDGFQTMTLVWTGVVAASQSLELRLADTEVLVAVAGLGTATESSWVLLEHSISESGPTSAGQNRRRWIFAGRSAAADTARETPESSPLPAARFQNLVPGEYRAIVVGSNHGATHGEPFTVGPRSKRLETVPVIRGGACTVSVTADDQGTPRAGVRVTIVDGSGRDVPQSMERLTDAEGQVLIESVPAGPIEVRLRYGNDALLMPGEFEPGQDGAPGELRVVFPED